MLKFRRICYRLSERKGQTMTEYALLLAGIAVAAFAGYSSLGVSANSAMNSASSLLASTTSTGAGTGTGTGGGGTGSDGGGGGDTGSGGDGGGGHHHHGGSGHHHLWGN
jgi:Flp pilus assembly pilin Flp